VAAGRVRDSSPAAGSAGKDLLACASCGYPWDYASGLSFQRRAAMTEANVNLPPGRSLQALLADQGTLAEEQALSVLRQLFGQVRALNAAGKTHRGISPQRVWMDPQGTVTLAEPEAMRQVGGNDADADACPPELQSSAVISLPAEIEAARQALAEQGKDLD